MRLACPPGSAQLPSGVGLVETREAEGGVHRVIDTLTREGGRARLGACADSVAIGRGRGRGAEQLTAQSIVSVCA
jgi:hypothetical protein